MRPDIGKIALAANAERGSTLAPATRARLDAALRDIDQLLLDDRGLPGRR